MVDADRFSSGCGYFNSYCFRDSYSNFSSKSIVLLDLTNQSTKFIQENVDGCRYWFTDFIFSPDGSKIAYIFNDRWEDSQNEGVNIINLE